MLNQPQRFIWLYNPRVTLQSSRRHYALFDGDLTTVKTECSDWPIIFFRIVARVSVSLEVLCD
jgi:hypothetical protein